MQKTFRRRPLKFGCSHQTRCCSCPPQTFPHIQTWNQQHPYPQNRLSQHTCPPAWSRPKPLLRCWFRLSIQKPQGRVSASRCLGRQRRILHGMAAPLPNTPTILNPVGRVGQAGNGFTSGGGSLTLALAIPVSGSILEKSASRVNALMFGKKSKCLGSLNSIRPKSYCDLGRMACLRQIHG